MHRRNFLTRSATAGIAAAATASLTALTSTSSTALAAPEAPLPVIKPKRLKAGDTVGLVAPATAIFTDVEADIARESLEALGLKVVLGQHMRDRHGNLAGDDKMRADDINRFFADKNISAVIPVRGGWGSARLLPYLDFETIKRNPKVLMGFSDITALHNSIQAKTGLSTLHGPNGGGRWDAWSVEWVKKILFGGDAVTMDNPKDLSPRKIGRAHV